MSDVERLARLLWQVRAESRGDAPEWGRGGYKTAADGMEEEARAILASDWLREREAAAERRALEKLANLIGDYQADLEVTAMMQGNDSTGQVDDRKPRLMPHEPKTNPELYRRLAEIEAHRASLPPEERARIEAEEREAQRQSWARQDMD